MPNPLKAIIGFVLVFVYHVPRLLYLWLLVSYAHVFNNNPNLTADPREHLGRAEKFLRRGNNSELLYAALEIRFALERIVDHELLLSEAATRRMTKEYEPRKMVANMRRINPASEHPHELFLKNPETGELIRWGEYKPLDQAKVREIQGRLGDLLHPKRGLLLGISEDPWYQKTSVYLVQTVEYLQERMADNTPFFFSEGLDQFEMVRSDSIDSGSAA